ncbi:PIG-L deacetylase family protein [Tessaracoccus antarcticus]|nr:PIG-L deacetylase family protein [Tessaracoccus antarcticus]
MTRGELADGAASGQVSAGLHRQSGGDHTVSVPAGVELRVAAPQPMALLLDQFDRTLLVPTLDRLGCTHFDRPEAELLGEAQPLNNFELIFIGAARVSDDEGIHTLREVLALNPSATIILLCRKELMTPPLLVAAMQAGVSDVADCRDAIALSTSIERVLRKADTRAERVLAIGAHPDDVEIGCGGTLLDHRRRGDLVSVLTLSRGAVGGDQSERILESTATAVSMGAQLFLADLPDTCVDPGVETIRTIEEIVRMVDPTVIYVHSKNDNHQDHRAVHIAAMSATRGVPQVFAFQSPSATNDFAPTRFVAIDEVIVRKVEVLGIFESQRHRSYLEPEMVIASARYWARNLAPRARYAEPFEILRSMTRTPTQPPTSSTSSLKPAPVVNIHRLGVEA